MTPPSSNTTSGNTGSGAQSEILRGSNGYGAQTNAPAGSGNANPPAGVGNPSGSQNNTGGSNTTLVNPIGNSTCSNNGTCLESFINSILQFVVYLGAIVVVFMLVYVGFLFVVARGDPTKITDARRALLYTVIGALILLGAQAISYGIQATVQAISSGS